MRNPANRIVPGYDGLRCVDCRLARADCLCALLPRIETRTRVVLVLHQLEDRKTTNTGRLALRCLANSALVIRGGRPAAEPAGSPAGATAAGPAPPARWDEAGEPVLLFPHTDARPLDGWRGSGRPVTLIVPDGTWRQAQRARHRVAGLAALPCAALAPALTSAYHLRSTPHPGRLATIEAVAEALGVLEGPAPRAALLAVFQVMVERMLRAKGRARVLGQAR